MRSTLIRFRLRMDTAGGVAAPEANGAAESTLRIRRDPHGKPHLPGSTVAGALRSHCTELNAGELFGPSPGSGRFAASPIQVLGTTHRGSTDTETRVRTAIDRNRGAADNSKLHGVEQLPAGTEFEVFLRWNDPDHRLEEFVEDLRAWRPRLGRGVTQGAGKCTVTGVGHRTFDLSTSEGLLAWLQISSPDDYPAALPTQETPVASEPLVDVEFTIVDGIHVGTGERRVDADGREVSTIVTRDDNPFIPGSSLKGVLRSRAEYICRVVGAQTCTGGLDNTHSATGACGLCVPCGLFGYTGKDGAGQRAKIAVLDTPIEGATTEQRRHVALDRFHGGAADKLLYTDDVVTSGRFRIRIEPLGPTLDERELLLLDAVLTDLDDGLIGIGARTTAGCGTVRMTGPRRQPRQPLTALSTQLRQESP